MLLFFLTFEVDQDHHDISHKIIGVTLYCHIFRKVMSKHFSIRDSTNLMNILCVCR